MLIRLIVERSSVLPKKIAYLFFEIKLKISCLMSNVYKNNKYRVLNRNKMNNYCVYYRTNILIIILVFMAFPVQAQNIMLLSGENIQESTRTYEYTSENDTAKVLVSTITEKIERNGDQLKFGYLQYIHRRNLQMSDSLITDRKTLKPIFYGTFAENLQSNSVDYADGDKIKIRINRAVPGLEADTSFTVRFEQIRFDAHWILPILYGLQIEPDLDIKIPTFFYSLGKSEMQIRFIREEQVNLNNKIYDTWRLKVKDPSLREATVWLDKKNQRLLMLKATSGGGKNGFTTWQRYVGDQ